jgi:transposase
MHGKPQTQPDFVTVVNLNSHVPAEHPLRSMKRLVDDVLQKLPPLFIELYVGEGRPSIPPEQLLKSRVLVALYRVRSELLFCEQLSYDHRAFTKNYERVLSAEVEKMFFAEVYDPTRQEGWTSDVHFTADGTLIDSWASLTSFERKDGGDQKKVESAKDADPGNPEAADEPREIKSRRPKCWSQDGHALALRPASG